MQRTVNPSRKAEKPCRRFFRKPEGVPGLDEANLDHADVAKGAALIFGRSQVADRRAVKDALTVAEAVRLLPAEQRQRVLRFTAEADRCAEDPDTATEWRVWDTLIELTRREAVGDQWEKMAADFNLDPMRLHRYLRAARACVYLIEEEERPSNCGAAWAILDTIGEIINAVGPYDEIDELIAAIGIPDELIPDCFKSAKHQKVVARDTRKFLRRYQQARFFAKQEAAAVPTAPSAGDPKEVAALLHAAITTAQRMQGNQAAADADTEARPVAVASPEETEEAVLDALRAARLRESDPQARAAWDVRELVNVVVDAILEGKPEEEIRRAVDPSQYPAVRAAADAIVATVRQFAADCEEGR